MESCQSDNLAGEPQGAVSGRLTRRQLLRRWLGYGSGALAASGTWGANVLDVTRHRVVMPGLADGQPIRVVQLSDLHRGMLVAEGMIRRAFEAAVAERPDLVLLTGDFVSRDAGFIDSCLEPVSVLSPRLGTWAVLGNHDYWTKEPEKVSASLRRHGVQALTNGNSEIERNLRLIGIDDEMAGNVDVTAAIRGSRSNEAKLIMAHNPLTFNRGMPSGSVLLSGHTHGGQVQFPGRNLILKRNFGYISGWYKNGPSRMYVNRGIGVVILPFRLFARPEVTVFDLVPG